MDVDNGSRIVAHYRVDRVIIPLIKSAGAPIVPRRSTQTSHHPLIDVEETKNTDIISGGTWRNIIMG